MNNPFAYSIHLPWENKPRIVDTLSKIMEYLKEYTVWGVKQDLPTMVAYFPDGNKDIKLDCLYQEKIVSFEEIETISKNIELNIANSIKIIKSGHVFSGDILWTDKDRAKLYINHINNARYVWKDAKNIDLEFE